MKRSQLKRVPAKVLPDEMLPERYENLTELLAGYWWETNIICVPFIASSDPHAFLRWLREREACGKIVFFPTVVSARLERLLEKRGYVPAITAQPDATFGQHVDGWAKWPA